MSDSRDGLQSEYSSREQLARRPEADWAKHGGASIQRSCILQPSARRTVRAIVLVLSVALALLFLFAGGSKLFYPIMHAKDFHDWGYPHWFIYVVGVIEGVARRCFSRRW